MSHAQYTWSSFQLFRIFPIVPPSSVVYTKLPQGVTVATSKDIHFWEIKSSFHSLLNLPIDAYRCSSSYAFSWSVQLIAMKQSFCVQLHFMSMIKDNQWANTSSSQSSSSSQWSSQWNNQWMCNSVTGTHVASSVGGKATRSSSSISAVLSALSALSATLTINYHNN